MYKQCLFAIAYFGVGRGGTCDVNSGIRTYENIRLTQMAKAGGIWHDPVWSKVIAAGIIAAGTAASTYFLKWWPAIGRAVVAVWQFLGAKTAVWNWLLIVATIWIILTIIEARLASLSARKRSAAPPYTADEFFGLLWRWQYSGREVTHLHCLCIHCGLQVYFVDMSDYRIVPRIGSKCDDCGNVVGPFDGTSEYLESKVIRLIHRHLREAQVKSASGSA